MPPKKKAVESAPVTAPADNRRRERSESPQQQQQPPAASKAAATAADDKKQKMATCLLPLKLIAPIDACAPGWFLGGQPKTLMMSHTGLFYNEALRDLPLPKASAKVAMFDFDGCVANTSLYRHGPDAWSVLYPATCGAVWQELLSHGYRIVIMSNQAEIGKATQSRVSKITEKVGRFNGFCKQIGLPVLIIAATCKTQESDIYRKPAIGMFTYLQEHLNDGVVIDKTKSFYCGDAAGRAKDHSDSDKKFAEKAGLKFFTEDECFGENAQHRKLFD